MREWFEQLPSRFHPERARQMQATVQFSVDGDGGGDWYVIIAEERCLVSEGRVEAPDATVLVSVDDWAAMLGGKLDPALAYFSGRLRVKGDLSLVTRCLTLFS